MNVVLVPLRDIGFGGISCEPKKYENFVVVSDRESARGMPKLDPQIYAALARTLAISPAVSHSLHQHLFDIRAVWKRALNIIR